MTKTNKTSSPWACDAQLAWTQIGREMFPGGLVRGNVWGETAGENVPIPMHDYKSMRSGYDLCHPG